MAIIENIISREKLEKIFTKIAESSLRQLARKLDTDRDFSCKKFDKSNLNIHKGIGIKNLLQRFYLSQTAAKSLF